jgi:hypothetical protein
MAAAVIVATGIFGTWPATEARDIPSRRQAELLALCRDALEQRLHLELRPEVMELPVVRAVGTDRYRLTGSVALHERDDPFSCDVDYRSGVPRVGDVHLLA